MKKHLFSCIMTLILSVSLVGFYSCNDSSGGGGGGGTSSKVPKVTTLDCWDYGSTWAYFDGRIDEDWDMDIEHYGVCWSKSGTPTVNSYVAYADYLYDSNYFYVFADDLDPNTTYYFRAFAENEKGIGYGEKKSVKTSQQADIWYYYDNGVNHDAIGTNGGSFYWGVMFPAGSYSGNKVTKVAAYDYMDMEGAVYIYNDGSYSPSNLVGQRNVNFYGLEDFEEYTFSSPITINPNKNLWVVFFNGSGATYPAATCEDTGDPNGRWVSINGSDWFDLHEADLYETFMVRVAIGSSKGEQWIGCPHDTPVVPVETPRIVNDSPYRVFRSFKNK